MAVISLARWLLSAANAIDKDTSFFKEGLFTSIGLEIEERIGDRLLKQINPDGSRFEKLSEKTIQFKSKENRHKSLSRQPLPKTYKGGGNFSSNLILVDRADMINSINSQNNMGNLSVSVGTPAEYAEYHQTGTNKMDQRKLIDTDNEDTEEDEMINDTINDYVDLALKGIF